MITLFLLAVLAILVGVSFITAGIKVQIEHNNRSKAAKNAWKKRGFVRIYSNGKLEKKVAYKRNPDIKWVSEIA